MILRVRNTLTSGAAISAGPNAFMKKACAADNDGNPDELDSSARMGDADRFRRRRVPDSLALRFWRPGSAPLLTPMSDCYRYRHEAGLYTIHGTFARARCNVQQDPTGRPAERP
jgi:hypothetical protein